MKGATAVIPMVHSKAAGKYDVSSKGAAAKCPKGEIDETNVLHFTSRFQLRWRFSLAARTCHELSCEEICVGRVAIN